MHMVKQHCPGREAVYDAFEVELRRWLHITIGYLLEKQDETTRVTKRGASTCT